MNEIDFSTSACRYCRFYKPEGRRGGSCQMLGVPVQSSWKACSLADSPFETTLKKLEDIFQLETTVKRESDRKTPSTLSKAKLEDSLQTVISPQLE
ncbi:MAG: hypothetical protein AAGE96_16430 [Cyanobacteria bacterium P01_G01_bin.19]